MLVINPGIQKNKGKVKKGLRQKELHSMSLGLLLRGAVPPESLPAGWKWKSNHWWAESSLLILCSGYDSKNCLVSCSRPSTAFSCSVLQLCFSLLSASTWLLTYPLPQAQTLSTFHFLHLNHSLPPKLGSFFWDKPKSLLLQEDITDHFSLQRSRSPEFTEPMCQSFDK